MTLLTALDVPGTPEQWRQLGFDCGPDGFRLTHVQFVVGRDAMGWGFDALEADASALGVPTREAPVGEKRPTPHPNGVEAVDHVVYTVTDLDDAIATLNKVLGAEPRRRAKPRGPDGPEMAFYRAGDAFLEVVGSGRPPALTGVAFKSRELHETVASIRASGGNIGDPKPAVQGGLIASVWTGFVGMPIAIMQPPQRPG